MQHVALNQFKLLEEPVENDEEEQAQSEQNLDGIILDLWSDTRESSKRIRHPRLKDVPKSLTPPPPPTTTNINSNHAAPVAIQGVAPIAIRAPIPVPASVIVPARATFSNRPHPQTS